MKLQLNKKIIGQYRSPAQIARVLTEDWTERMSYCPNCGSVLTNYENNRPVADFYCQNCREEYELKSKRNTMSKKIPDGAYKVMLERLQSNSNPNFFFLNYDLQSYEVINFVVIPKHFFVPEIIIPRKNGIPGRPKYIMCSIDLSGIPESGKIFYIKDKQIEKKENVLSSWRRTLFLRESKKVELKGWILDIMKCIDSLNKSEFTLQELYNFENVLSKKYPNNKHIKDKIRQQLQLLRDKNYLEFLGGGKYKLT